MIKTLVGVSLKVYHTIMKDGLWGGHERFFSTTEEELSKDVVEYDEEEKRYVGEYTDVVIDEVRLGHASGVLKKEEEDAVSPFFGGRGAKQKVGRFPEVLVRLVCGVVRATVPAPGDEGVS